MQPSSGPWRTRWAPKPGGTWPKGPRRALIQSLARVKRLPQRNWSAGITLRGRALVTSKGTRTYAMMIRAAEHAPFQLWPAVCAASGPAARAESDLDGATAVTSSAHT